MKLTIDKLTLTNFKGFLKEHEFTFDDVTLIGGDNGTGKTTIVDAVFYVLFGKDSLDRVNFGIKPIYTKGTKKGQPINKLDSVVEVTFDHNGEKLVLKKTYSEEWTKKRGSAVETFKGHKTVCEWNGVPIGIAEYNRKVADLVDAEVFKTLSNPNYFSSRKTAEKRALLFELIDDIDFDDIVAHNADLAELRPLLERHSEEELLKMRKASQSKINAELKQIPARIDELEALLNEDDVDGLESEKAVLEGEIKRVSAEIAGLRNDKKRDEIQAQRAKVLEEVATLQDAEEKAYREELAKLFNGAQLVQREVKENRDRLYTLDDELSRIARDLENSAQEVDRLRAEWVDTDAEEYNGETTCPTCGKPLDEHVIEEATERFNQSKAAKLAKARETAEKGLAHIKSLKAKQETLQKEKELLLHQKERHLEKQTEAEERYSKAFIAGPPKSKDLEELEAKLKALGEELTAQAVPEELPKLNAKATQLQESLLDVERRITRQGMNEGYARRIKELDESMRELSNSFEENERVIFLLEEYAKAKVALVSDALNAKFELVKWKLYDVQINGGLAETCVATVGGIPYDEGLNNAARINAGLDIINAFSRHYGVKVPVFIDNAESVNRLIDTEGQKVALYVTDDAELVKMTHIVYTK